MKRVLVLDANQRSALAVTRSLGRHGIPLYTADEIPIALAGCSRFCQQHFVCPSPGQEPNRFIDYLANLVKRHDINILLPMTELTTELLLKHHDSFPGALLPFPDMDTVNSLADKCSLMRVAESLDVPIPQTWYADNPTSLPCELEELTYPIVLKPGKSWLLQQNHWNRATVRFAQNTSEAREILDSDLAFQAYPFMIQEHVEGRGQGVFALYDHGKPLAFFAHRRLREKPPSGGVSVLSESVAVDPDLETHARSLLNKASWHGIAMVEFKVAPDGTPYLMEINTRFWGSLQLAIDAGVDFPYLLYQLTCNKEPEPVAKYRTGIRLRWLLGDLDRLYLVLRDRRCTLWDKLGTMLQFLTPSPIRTRHEVNRWGDLGPSWCELRQYVRNILR